MATDPIVIVGGGLAAGRLAAEYRESGGEADVTILTAEPDPPYHRPPLTKGFLRGEQDRDSTLLQPLPAWEGNPTADRFVACLWRGAEGWLVVAVNYGDRRAQCYLRLPFVEGACVLRDRMNPGRG